MVTLTGVTLLWGAHQLFRKSFRLLLHPVSLLLMLHVLWITVTVITSTGPLVSLKFLLAKIWYVVPFYILSYILLRDEASIRTWFLSVMIPLCITILVVMARHAADGFSFEDINKVLSPFYRNHVDYGLILGVVFPFAFVLAPRWMPKYLAWGICLLILMAIYFTYTRTAYVGLAVATCGYLAVRWKIVRYGLLLALIVVGSGVFMLSKNNRYIDYAPDYYKTVTHYRFGNLLEATYKFEDISTMERFYRWIAAFYMVQEHPITGFGPNNFVPHYKPFTDEHFVTYVSDNPEQSGVHNYFLMTTVEQGLPGLMIFATLLVITLLRTEWLFHQLKPGFYRKLLTGVIGSLFFILFALLLNDMIETDKVGSFFFLNLAMIAIIERNARRSQEFISQPVTTAGKS